MTGLARTGIMVIWVLTAVSLPMGASAGEATFALDTPVVITNLAGQFRLLVKSQELASIQGVLVTSAHLEFTLPGMALPVPLEVEVYPLGRSWDATNATWQQPWTEPGGDVDPEFFSVSTLAAARPATLLRLDVTPMVRAMVKGDKSNYGFVLSIPRARGEGFRPQELTRLGGLTSGQMKVTFLRTTPRGWRTG